MAKKTKAKKKISLLLASEEIKVGKYDIGFVSSDFVERFGSQKFASRTLGSFQRLPRAMSDAEIESELKPGLCELGDVLAFLKNPPEGTKDGNWNLFYTPAFVVYVRWYSGSSFWSVSTWPRDDIRWRGGGRVFSPATDSSSALNSSDTLTLSAAIKMVKKEGYRIFKEI